MKRTVYSVLHSDAYKYAMAQAGFPLRLETFSLTFRHGGWQYIPFDLEAEIRAMLDFGIEGLDYLAEHGYGLTPAMEAALDKDVTIKAAPKGTWVWEREPIVTVTGPSFLVSWLEPLVLRLSFAIQFATEVMKGTVTPDMLVATCSEQEEIMRRVLKECGKNPDDPGYAVTLEDVEYAARVRKTVASLIHIVGSPERVFEVGMRAATCEEQHMIALQAAREAGLTASSNVSLAQKLGQTPIGTMGHEHIQRWGNDLEAYRAMRDTRVGKPSYLLDTFDTAGSGIPAALQVMQEQPHEASIRYDSGDKYGQYMFAHGCFREAGIEVTHILEDGLNLEMTQKFEHLREFTGVAPEKQVYGYGGFIVSKSMTNPLTRDRVSAVYKLTWSVGPRMKFGNETGLGKVSVPGNPETWRRLRGDGVLSMIGQAGERPPENFIVLNGNPEAAAQIKLCNAGPPRNFDPQPYTLSPETQKLVDELRKAS